MCKPMNKLFTTITLLCFSVGTIAAEQSAFDLLYRDSYTIAFPFGYSKLSISSIRVLVEGEDPIENRTEIYIATKNDE